MNKKKWLSLVKMLAPLVIGVVKPELAPIIDKVTDGIGEAEELFTKGSDKLKHVKELASTSADVVNELKKKEVIDKAELDNAVTNAVETVVAVVNLVEKKTVPEVPEG